MPNKSVLSHSKTTTLLWIAALCALVLVAGLFLAPDRAWSNLLIGTFFVTTIGLGGTVFVALTYVTGGGWQVAFRRVPEAMAMIVPTAGCALLVVLFLRMKSYGWHHHGHGDAGTFWFKELWLTPAFWFARAIGYVLVWSILGGWLVSRSRSKPPVGSPQTFLTKNTRMAAVFLAIYALTFSLASADWIMALEPMWFSTMWGVYNFSGMILAALAVVVILCILLSQAGGPLAGIFRTDHLHDLGRLLIGFSCFWMYIWFSQYMLIWYSNIPEETSYFITRTHGPWAPVVIVSIVLNWVVPFFVLLPRPAKRSASVMMKIAVVLLVGRWVDLWLMVSPSTMGATPAFGLWEVAGIGCIAAILLPLLFRSFPDADPVPTNDPYLPESLHYHA